MEKVLNKMGKSGIDYKAGDLKPEIHFLGSIVGASSIVEDDGIFCEAFFETGDKWKCLSPNSTVQTQTGYSNVNRFLKE